MKYKTAIYICIGIIIAVFLLYRFIGTTSQSKNVVVQPQNQNELSMQENSEGSVTVKVTPENISEDQKTWQFRIVLDTHAGSLDEDLTKSAVLIEDEEELQPVSWEGDSPGGHHREGVLIFKQFSQKPKSVTLILQNVGGISERKFMW